MSGKKEWLKRTQGRLAGVNVLASYHFSEITVYLVFPTTRTRNA